MAYRESTSDTIAALASAPGSSERGIIRLSGPGIRAILESHFVPTDMSVGRSADTIRDQPWGRTSAWRTEGLFHFSRVGIPFPGALYFWPDSRSYTGERLAELHLPGSPPLLEMVLAELFHNGARPAQPGEFTLRSFLAGRIDLTQAEAVLGVIDATTDVELRRALQQLAGGVLGSIQSIRSNLLDLLADLEAGLDFVEEDIEFISQAEIGQRLQSAIGAIIPLIGATDGQYRGGARWRVTLVGPANAGKSTLFNALVGRHVALVSNQAGTTRDFLEAELDMDGVPVLLVDTAGEQDVVTEIDSLAQSQRISQLHQTDLIVFCHPAIGLEHPIIPPDKLRGIRENCPILTVYTKSDLVDLTSTTSRFPIPLSETQSANEVCRVSVFDPFSVQELARAIARMLTQGNDRGRQLVGSTMARTRDSLENARSSLERGLEIVHHASDQDLLAMEIRDSLQELGKVTGAVYTDDVLDRIFSKFCIGK